MSDEQPADSSSESIAERVDKSDGPRPAVVAGSCDDLTLPPPPPSDYTDGGVPNLDFLRDRIEGRLARAEGSTELAAGGDEARSFAEQAQAREAAAAEKLAEIRRSLGRDG